MRQFLILKFLPIFLFLRWTAAWIGPRVHHSTRPRFSAVLFGPVSGNRLRVAPSSSCGKPKLIDDDPFELVQANSHLGRKRFLSNAPSPKNMTIGMTIVGGQDVMPGDVCWQAKLAKDGFFHCGASIIGKRTVMTASHCVYDYSKDQSATPDHFKVTIGAPLSNTNSPRGTLDPSGCAQDFSVVQVITNSRFNKKINENDIAILVLGEAIDFSRRCACPVCLKSRLPKVGEICAVSGFGLEREGGAGGRNPRPLKFVHLNVLETKYGNQCAIDKGYGTPPNLNNFLCAGNVIGEDTCQGDSGGPVVCFDQRTRSHYQAGIVSYGRGCGRGVGGIYTRVSSYLNWIRANSGGDQLHLDLRN